MDNQSGNGILEEFRVEFVNCWQRLPNKGFFIALLVAWFALFQFVGNSTLGYLPTRSLFRWLYTAYNPPILEPTDAHGNLVPFVVLALFWWKRKELLGAELRTWPPGLLVLAIGLVFHVLGYAVQQPRLSVVGLFIGVYGFMGMAWGPEWLKRSFFPFFLFAFAVPLGSLSEPITFRLRLLVSQLAEVVSHYALSIDVVRTGTSLADPTGRYNYEVAAACSGLRSLVATVGFGIVLGFISFKQWWKWLLMVAAAFPLAVLGNLLRMLAIIIAAEFGGQEAGNYVHHGGPWGLMSLLPYVPAFIGLLMLERWLRKGSLAIQAGGDPNQGKPVFAADPHEPDITAAAPAEFKHE